MSTENVLGRLMTEWGVSGTAAMNESFEIVKINKRATAPAVDLQTLVMDASLVRPAKEGT